MHQSDDLQQLATLSGAQAMQYARQLIERLSAQIHTEQEQRRVQQAQLKFEQTKNAALTFELARLKQWRFGTSSESMDAAQSQLFEAKELQVLVAESKAEDNAADLARTLAASPVAARPKGHAKRQALPSGLQRIEHHYEITPAVCLQGHSLSRIGQEISEQLDCVPAQFFVHRHIRGKYCCATCQTILAASMPAQIIDKGIPAPGLLAQVIIAKHDDHLPLYRQEEIYRRSGAFIARSSMASWIGQCGVQLEPLAAALRQYVLGCGVLHGDETPIKLLTPGAGKTHQAYAWVWRTSDLETHNATSSAPSAPSAMGAMGAMGGATDSAPEPRGRAVIYDFCLSRAGEHARKMLQDFSGVLVTDDYSGYKALYAAGKVTEAGCWAHARRKFFEAHKLNKSEIAKEAVARIAQLYAIEQEVQTLSAMQRLQIRQERSAPLLAAFKVWLLEQRAQLARADVTAKAIDYTLRRWQALTVHLQDARIPVDNNAVENAIRPLALGRKNWLFVGSQQAGERAAVLMSLIESAKLNGHDAWAYLRDILTKLPTWPNSRLGELLPHRWQPAAPAP
jgi:transposase